jgi:hypothetical protein
MSQSRPVIGERVPQAEAVVAAALHAFEAQDWRRLITLTDPGSIETLKTGYLAGKRVAMRQPPMFDLADFASGEIPEELRQWALTRRQFGELAGITTLDQVEALDHAEFLVRWAQARHPHYLVDGVSPWHPGHVLNRREVMGSVAVLPDTVAVLVRATEVHAINTLGGLSLVAVLGDNAGGWSLDASSAWLGLVDAYA